MKPDEAVVYDVCIELLRERNLTDATFQKAKTILGEQHSVNLVAVTGFYVKPFDRLPTCSVRLGPFSKSATHQGYGVTRPL
jgi:hypothetical protein